MGSTFQADTPGNRHIATLDVASVASDGAASRFVVLNAAQNIQILAAKWEVQGADQGANSASYRSVQLVNGGSAGTATTVVASLGFTASLASLSNNALTGTATVASGAQVMFSQNTVGGAHSDGTVVIAGRLQVEYRLL